MPVNIRALMEHTEKTLKDDSDIYLKTKSVLDFLSRVCVILSEKKAAKKAEVVKNFS
ncbi:hypothetical protein AGMMS49546_19920 [Spirochaetia bacterium]|nr:hypothetical protein AGMMS49546_19920 [Spirochaetia bacterium]